MIDIDENTITAAVNARIGPNADPRLAQVMESLTRHLHSFVREVGLTEEEWKAGIDFLMATGQMCSDKRQEFILLSDVLGVSMLGVAMNNRKPKEATEATVFGPFHVEGSDWFEYGADISGGASGVPCVVSGQVRAIDGTPLAGAVLDIWHADDAGFYDVQLEHDELRCRGRMRTDASGHFKFRTVKPVAYPIPSDGPVGHMLEALGRHPWRPAHIHFMVQADGYETLVTHCFDKGDIYLESDTVFGVRASLISEFVLHTEGAESPEAVPGLPFYTLDFDLVLNPLPAPSHLKTA
jgi:hydroxyquinol 1,2-dioxygenase